MAQLTISAAVRPTGPHVGSLDMSVSVEDAMGTPVRALPAARFAVSYVAPDLTVKKLAKSDFAEPQHGFYVFRAFPEGSEVNAETFVDGGLLLVSVSQFSANPQATAPESHGQVTISY